MSDSCENLSIGDWVVLTKEGAKAHRNHHRMNLVAGGAVLGAVVLPLALPGAFLATVGIASGGAGIAIGATAQVAVGAAGGSGLTSFIANYLENHPEAEAIGVIRDKRERWWGQEGHDYEVVWSNDEPFGESSWHLAKHLRQIESPLNPTEIPIG